MMQATENGPPDHLTSFVFRQVGHTGWVGNLLIKALMRTSLIEELTVLVDDAPDMFFTQNQDVVQTFTADAADEPFANGVCFGGIGWRVNDFDASPFDRVFKMRSILVVIIAQQKARAFAKGRGFSHLLRDPLIGGGAGHPDMHHPSRAVFDDEKQKNRPEEQVIGLHKGHSLLRRCPDLRRVIRQKGRPTLAVMLRWQLTSGLPHVVSNGSPVYSDPQFQQFPSNAF